MEYSVFNIDKMEHSAMDIEIFAQSDGFANWNEMREFFKKQYGLPFMGWLYEFKITRTFEYKPKIKQDITKLKLF